LKRFEEVTIDVLSLAGRPVDVQPLLDGSLLISDDLAGAVYRVTYNKASVPDGA
jgi:glucose/arabinose dehydrogenase